MPLFALSFGSAAVEFLDSLPPGKLRAQIAKKAKSLITEPHPAGCKKLSDMTFDGEALWRVRVRDYRILYVCRNNEVVVVDIDHRKDVYR